MLELLVSLSVLLGIRMWLLEAMFLFFWPHCSANVILVPWLGIELVPSVVEAWSLNHWTIRKVLLAFLIGQVYLATNSPSFCLSKTVLFSLILKDNFAWLTVFSFLLFVLLLSLTSMIADEKSTQSYHRSLLCDNMLLSHCFQFYLSTVCLWYI